MSIHEKGFSTGSLGGVTCIFDFFMTYTTGILNNDITRTSIVERSRIFKKLSGLPADRVLSHPWPVFLCLLFSGRAIPVGGRGSKGWLTVVRQGKERFLSGKKKMPWERFVQLTEEDLRRSMKAVSLLSVS